MLKKKGVAVLVTLMLLLSSPLSVLAAEVKDEIDFLKRRLEQLEKKLQEQDAEMREQRQALADQTSTLHEIKNIKKVVSGLEFDLNATTVVQGVYNNDDNWKENPGVRKESDDWDANYTVDLEISSRVGKAGLAMLHLVGGEGAGQNSEVAGFSRVNDTAIGDDADFKVAEIWYEHAFNDMFRITFGKLNLERWFDTNAVANDRDTQFLNDAFVNNVVLDLPADYNAKDYTYGARLGFTPNELLEINLGVIEFDGDFEDIFDELLYIGELALKPTFGERQGNYRVYGWYNRTDYVALSNRGDDDEHGYGFGASIDQQLNKGVTMFGRLGWRDDDVYPIKFAWSAGVQLDGTLWNRERDAFGLAYGAAYTGSDYRDSVQRTRVIERPIFPPITVRSPYATTPAEHIVEAYYKFQINDIISLTPDLQYLRDMGAYDADDVWLFGVRANLQF